MSSIAPGDKVRALRNITRREGAYVSQGDLGVVEECFRSPPTGMNNPPTWYAKVRINNVLKTLRLTSIEKVPQ